ncbi:uncharacterized protein [Primulina huaijiensis]|uniref:uncharacterized protein n=1 Tax=Primulina huaijiensis TaxID=1492673 RepID=UPI003CC78049
MAASRNSSSSYKFQTWVTLFYRKRIVSGGPWPSRLSHRRELPPYCCGSVDQGLRFFSGSSTAHAETKLAMGKYQSADRVQSSIPAPHKNGFSNWMKWTLGSLLSLLLPLLGKTWKNVLRLEGKVEVVGEEVEAVAEVAESVANAADKVLKEVVEELPSNSKFKEAAEDMEYLCCVAAQDSKLIQNLIHKAGEVKQDLEDMDTIIQTAFGDVQLAEETKKPT